jgi:hypothetical protein
VAASKIVGDNPDLALRHDAFMADSYHIGGQPQFIFLMTKI